MKLLVQTYLETHTFADLIKEHGVYASLSKNKKKISVNYDQIETKDDDVLSWDCRGLILCKEDYSEFNTINDKLDLDFIPGTTKVIAFPMRRFFNLGQGSAANIDFNDPRLSILEKLDGSLIILHWCPITNQWQTATRSVCQADLLMDNGIFTFRTLFEKACEETTELTFDAFTGLLNKNITYCFELCSPLNQIVVKYPNKSITLLAVRDLATHKELNFNHDEIMHINGVVPFVKCYQYNSIQELVDWVSTLNPLEHEGVVVRDSNFNRIKIKNAAYVAASRLRDTLGASERNCVELILAEKDDDVGSFLPEEIIKNLQKIKSGLQLAIKEHDLVYQNLIKEWKLLTYPDKKNFAISVQMLEKEQKGKIWTAPLFKMFDHKASNMKEFITDNRKAGTWGDSFLDKLLDLSKKYQE